MKEHPRFVKEFANYQKQNYKGCENYNTAVEIIDRVLRLYDRWKITTNEAMRILSDPLEIYRN